MLKKCTFVTALGLYLLVVQHTLHLCPTLQHRGRGEALTRSNLNFWNESFKINLNMIWNNQAKVTETNSSQEQINIQYWCIVGRFVDCSKWHGYVQTRMICIVTIDISSWFVEYRTSVEHRIGGLLIPPLFSRKVEPYPRSVIMLCIV